MEYEEAAVSVCNDALLELGQKVPIKHLVAPAGETLSPNEVVCASKYPLSRRMVLRAHRWNFASRIQHVGCSPFDSGFDGFCFRFKRPARCLTVCGVEGHRAFRSRGEWIYTRQPVRSVEFVEDVENPDEWDADVRTALVRRLAADLAQPIVGLGAAVELAEQRYAIALGDAKRVDAQEGRDFDYCGLDPISASMEAALPHVGDWDGHPGIGIPASAFWGRW